MNEGANYPLLQSPLRIGPMQLQHRAVMSAHGMGLGGSGPGISDRYRAYLLERAHGGAAMIGIESSPVHASTFSRSLVIRLDDDQVVPSLARLADEVHAAGARLAITLWHGGHKDGALRGPYSVAPSAVPNMMGEVPKVLSRSEIATIVRAYGAAAARCRAAGLDCLEVQTATDYLLGSFLSPALNHRVDAYGGSLENRARIVCEILEAVRAAAGDRIAVGVRTSTRHAIPGARPDYTLEESIAAMSLLERAGLVDYVSVMAGSAWAEGHSIPAMHHARMAIAPEAAEFKRALRVPIFIAGRIRTAAEAEALLAAGSADVIAMARTWIAEPEWMLKLRTNRSAQIRPCLSCNQGCVAAVFRGLPGSCILNPRAGRELEWPQWQRPARAASPRRSVAVIGGGPAGLEAARLAAERGFDVMLYERQSELGGQWRDAGRTPGRGEILLSLEWWSSELRRLGVKLHLRSAVDAATPPRADHLIWATGGVPAQTAVWRLRPHLFAGIPGATHAAHGRDVMRERLALSGRVALIDEEGGWPALSLAHYLLAQSAITRLEILTSAATFAESALAVTFELGALQQLTAARTAGRVMIHPNTLVQLIDKDRVTALDARTFGPYDRIVLSTGTQAAPTPEDALAVGDCVAPRGVWSATCDAARLISGLPG